MSETCGCCRRSWDACFPGSAARRELRPFVCRECKDHQGFTIRSDPEHLQLWRALLAKQQREHDQEMAGLRARVAELEERLRKGPRPFGEDEIRAAQSKAQHAYQSRETAWRALCEIRLLHREGTGSRCRCGERFGSCAESQIVDKYPALAKWEKEQYDRVQLGLDHSLPDRHPAVVDPHWRPD